MSVARVRKSFVNLLLFASLRAKSELEHECNKQDFERAEEMTTSIVASLA